MKYLLDTHVIIWYFDDSVKLSEKTLNIIKGSNRNLYISSISLWEIAIKMSIGKLDLDVTLKELFAAVKNSDIIILHLEDEYLQTLSNLPFIHKDPFDRLLVATALTENLTIVTIDENIQKYAAPCVW